LGTQQQSAQQQQAEDTASPGDVTEPDMRGNPKTVMAGLVIHSFPPRSMDMRARRARQNISV
jgi:hypothetical protein